LPELAPSVPVRAFIAALLLLLGYALSVAARTGLADVYAEEAKSYLQTKREAGEVLTRDESGVLKVAPFDLAEDDRA